MEFINVITERRSIRRFKQDAVPNEMIRELLDGWVAAASELILESRNQDGAWLQHWLANRLEQLAEERLAVTVQHVDLLALPEDG